MKANTAFRGHYCTQRKVALKLGASNQFYPYLEKTLARKAAAMDGYWCHM